MFSYIWKEANIPNISVLISPYRWFVWPPLHTLSIKPWKCLRNTYRQGLNIIYYAIPVRGLTVPVLTLLVIVRYCNKLTGPFNPVSIWWLFFISNTSLNVLPWIRSHRPDILEETSKDMALSILFSDKHTNKALCLYFFLNL